MMHALSPRLAAYCLLLLLFTSCSVQQHISASAKEKILSAPALKNAHVGISIFEPATGRYWYNYQADKFFTPASNTKIFTCYAGMKYLGDSLEGMRYATDNNTLYLQPTGDPSLLHPDFKQQPVIHFLQQQTASKLYITNDRWKDEALGAGWSWDDYNDDYMAERNSLPVYGNSIKFVQTQTEEVAGELAGKPQVAIFTNPEINWKLNFSPDTGSAQLQVKRNYAENIFTITEGKEKAKEIAVPFVTHGLSAALELLKDTLKKEVQLADKVWPQGLALKTIYSQPADSVFAPMMHRSDNFFAEQTLLMVADKLMGQMNDALIIDSLLKTDFKDLPQHPAWADGSGLSRFNLFTPLDFIWVLNKMKTDFPWQRIATIFPTGNTGTLTNYYVSDSGFIYAKTGTLSGVVAISGFLTTAKNKSLIFSVLVNNHASSGRAVRRAVESFIQSIRRNY
ncbi:MAG TPA: D-alanyl-D-alanine carboxypeptidase/D-alanyl-D-alanine-endopeptidase [Chitinophagaceae bacterium]|nr:D-alanyl-D-alanine carboxypeptidase/D-alanyl-D-alanine-endopeptidase [Chitinophagaceae bacterium]